MIYFESRIKCHSDAMMGFNNNYRPRNFSTQDRRGGYSFTLYETLVSSQQHLQSKLFIGFPSQLRMFDTSARQLLSSAVEGFSPYNPNFHLNQLLPLCGRDPVNIRTPHGTAPSISDTSSWACSVRRAFRGKGAHVRKDEGIPAPCKLSGSE